MPHLVSHDRLNFFRRPAAQEVVIEGDAHRVGEAADVGAHPRRLPRGIDFVHIFRGNPVGSRHAQNGVDNLRIVEARDFIKNGNYVDWRDQHGEDQEHDGYGRSPDPPGSRKPANDAEQQHRQQSAQHRVHGKLFHLIAHPGAEGLRGESILVFAEIIFVNGAGEEQDAGEYEVLQPVHKRVHRLEASDAFRQIPHAGGPPQIQQQQRNHDSIEKIPKNHPVAALEISVGTGRLVGRNLREVSIGGRSSIEVRRGLCLRRNLDHGWHLIGGWRLSKRGSCEKSRAEENRTTQCCCKACSQGHLVCLRKHLPAEVYTELGHGGFNFPCGDGACSVFHR